MLRRHAGRHLPSSQRLRLQNVACSEFVGVDDRERAWWMGGGPAAAAAAGWKAGGRACSSGAAPQSRVVETTGRRETRCKVFN